MPPAQTLLTTSELVEAAALWSTEGRRLFDPDVVYHLSTRTALRIGSVWAVDDGWVRRASDEKYDDVAADLAARGWSSDRPAVVTIGKDGFLTLADGNHRITLILTRNLLSRVSSIPVKFHFFDVGDPINPLRPDITWSGANLAFICFPRGTCGRCAPCRKMLPEIERLLDAVLPSADEGDSPQCEIIIPWPHFHERVVEAWDAAHAAGYRHYVAHARPARSARALAFYELEGADSIGESPGETVPASAVADWLVSNPDATLCFDDGVGRQAVLEVLTMLPSTVHDRLYVQTSAPDDHPPYSDFNVAFLLDAYQRDNCFDDARVLLFCESHPIKRVRMWGKVRDPRRSLRANAASERRFSVPFVRALRRLGVLPCLYSSTDDYSKEFREHIFSMGLAVHLTRPERKQ